MSKLNQAKTAPPAVIVIFGAAGDLTKRKLIPAQVAMVGVDRVEQDSGAYRQGLSKDIESYVGEGFNQELWDASVNNLHYMLGDFRNAESYQQLKNYYSKLTSSREP